jgi:hypothetical protein
MSDLMDRIIADLVEGAQRSEGFMRGGRAGVEVARENRGREEKLAMDASTMLSGIPLLGPQLAGLNAAARDNSMGSGFATGMGAGLGQLGGAAAGHALGGLTDNDKLQLLATLLGGMGGGALGGAAGRGLRQHIQGEGDGKHEKDAALKAAIFGGAGGLMTPQAAAASMLSGGGAAMRPQAVAPAAKPSGAKPPPLPAAALAKMHASSPFAAPPKLGAHYDNGASTALAAFGIKEAFLPMVGALLGGTALRAGVGALARRGAGSAMGRMAGKVAPHMSGGIGGAATDMVGSMAGGALGQKLMPQQPQQPGM